MDTLVNPFLQLVSGAAGGSVAGAALKDFNVDSLGVVGSTIIGAIGGVIGGHALQALIPAIAGTATGDIDLGSVLGQLVGGGISGAFLAVIVGLVRDKGAGHQHG